MEFRESGSSWREVRTIVYNRIKRKRLYAGDILLTPLKRCLTTPELTFFGISHMIGSGIFVLMGTLLKELAGPAGAVSFIIGAISAAFAALCYAELSGRLPKTGSCYNYTHFAMGELAAFIIGWMLISDFIIDMAAGSKAFSAVFDSLLDNKIRNSTIEIFGIWNFPGLDQTPDFLALLLVLCAMLVNSFGAKFGLVFNMVCTVLQLIVLIVLIFFCFPYGNFANWSPSNGGFMPFGISGILAGASACAFAYSGFDAVSNAAEEARNPGKSIPLAMFIGIGLVAILYILSTVGISILVPRDQIDINAPFAYAFDTIGIKWIKYFAAIGTLISTAGTKLTGLYIIPRLIYALASDGLLFPIFARVSSITDVPIISLLVGGFIAAILAFTFDLSILAELMSLGVLIASLTVGFCLIIIRDLNLKVSF